MRRIGGAGLIALALGGCTTSAPPPPAAPTPAAPPRIAAPPAPTVDWRDIPETPGRWGYAGDANGSSATFTETGGIADFVLHCSKAARTVSLSRPGMSGAITVTTSYAAKSWPSSPVVLPAADPTLDQIAFSRGRFTIDLAGAPRLVLPAWAEPARVIEDCRG